MANKTKLTVEKRDEFLEALSECGNVTHAAKGVGVSRQQLYVVRGEDEEFAAKWDEAAKLGAARLEDEARRRAVEGWEEGIWHRGQKVGTVRKFSDTLLIFLLKGAMPEKYAERQRVEQTVKVDHEKALVELEGNG